MGHPVRYHEGRFPPSLDWERLVASIGPTASALARYDGLLQALWNPDLLVSPLFTQEAVLSSRIEGTQATMGEVLEYEAGATDVPPQRKEDIREIFNYRSAMRTAEAMLVDLPLCQRVLREAHRILLQGARGENRAPGEYRRIPNWIGPPGCSMEEAHFIPIDAAKLPAAMDAWERYMHSTVPDRLVQLAVLHAEFEALHPFLDGNGRLGRMMVPLFLWQFGLIQRPVLYISAYFERNRDQYYDLLLAVSRDDDWTGWAEFFLLALREQAEENLVKVRSMLALYEDLKGRLPATTRSPYAVRALDWMFARPVFDSADFVNNSGIPSPTARRLLQVFRDQQIVSTIVASRGRRGAVLALLDLIARVEGRGAFADQK